MLQLAAPFGASLQPGGQSAHGIRLVLLQRRSDWLEHGLFLSTVALTIQTRESSRPRPAVTTHHSLLRHRNALPRHT